MAKKIISQEELTVPVLLNRLEQLSKEGFQKLISFEGKIKGAEHVSHSLDVFRFSEFLKVYCHSFRVSLEKTQRQDREDYFLRIYQNDGNGKRVSEIKADYALRRVA